MSARRPHRAGDWFRILPIREEPAFALLPLYARALEAELRKVADDQGRIALDGRDPAEVICKLGGATIGERRQVRRDVALLLAKGFLRVDGMDLVVVQMTEVEREPCTSRARTVHESSANRARVEREPCTNFDLTTRNHSEAEGYTRGDQRRSEEKKEEILPSVGSAREQPELHGSLKIQKPEPCSRPDPGSGPTGRVPNQIATTGSTGSPTPVVPSPDEELEIPGMGPLVLPDGSHPDYAGKSSNNWIGDPALQQRAVEVKAICDAMRADVAAGVPVAAALPRFMANLGVPGSGLGRPVALVHYRVPLQGPPEPPPTKVRREPKPPTRRAPRGRPADWEPSAAHVELGARLGFRKHRVLGEAEKFTGHWDAAGKMWADWDAAFGCWLRKAREIDDRNGVPYDEPCEPLFADRRHVIPGDQETLPEELRGLTVEQMQAKMKERVRLVVEAKKRFAKLAAQPAEEVH